MKFGSICSLFWSVDSESHGGGGVVSLSYYPARRLVLMVDVEVYSVNQAII